MDERAFSAAASVTFNEAIVSYLVSIKAPLTETALIQSIQFRNDLSELKRYIELSIRPKNPKVLEFACGKFNRPMIEYLVTDLHLRFTPRAFFFLGLHDDIQFLEWAVRQIQGTVRAWFGIYLYASQGGHRTVLDWAYDKGIELKSRADIKISDCIKAAIERGHVDVLWWFLEKGHKIVPDKEEEAEDWWEPAVTNGYIPTLQLGMAKGLTLNSSFFSSCIFSRRKDMFTFLEDNGCPVDYRSLASAVKNGDLAMVSYLRNQRNVEWDEAVSRAAAGRETVAFLQVLLRNGCPLAPDAIESAALFDNVPMVRFLFEQHKQPISSSMVGTAAANNRLRLLKYFLSKKTAIVGFDSAAVYRSVVHVDADITSLLQIGMDLTPTVNYPVLNAILEMGVQLRSEFAESAAADLNLQLLKWLRRKGCPMDLEALEESLMPNLVQSGYQRYGMPTKVRRMLLWIGEELRKEGEGREERKEQRKKEAEVGFLLEGIDGRESRRRGALLGIAVAVAVTVVGVACKVYFF